MVETLHLVSDTALSKVDVSELSPYLELKVCMLMTTKSDVQLALLAAALDDQGRPVYDLWLQCPGDGGTGLVNSRYCMFDFPDQEEGWTCPCKGKNQGRIPNPDPMALIAACDSKEWQFLWRAGTLWLWNDGSTEWPIKVEIPDFLAALTDAVFQATEPLAVNWEGCNGDGTHEEDAICLPSNCDFCRGTGRVLSGAKEAV